ncbi:hypothetical protein [Gemmiger formicilis]|uniref:hypothetical protein n=1 Tax=Gemmiger formicilis TaxID=745368 RepID=UPI003521DCAD
MELCEATPSLVQSRRLKEMSQSGTLTEHYLHTLLTEQKPNQRQKFFLNQSDVQRFFPPGYTPEQMQNTIFSLLKTWGHMQVILPTFQLDATVRAAFMPDFTLESLPIFISRRCVISSIFSNFLHS